jgi:ketosteroid isomerase-like protein
MGAEEDREELARLEEDWMRAMQERDEEALERYVADGFRFTAVHLSPEPMTREQWMGAAMGGYTIMSFAYESMDIDVFGDTGVIHARYSQMASYDAVNLSNAFRLTDVWSRIDGRWQVVARHSSTSVYPEYS